MNALLLSILLLLCILETHSWRSNLHGSFGSRFALAAKRKPGVSRLERMKGMMNELPPLLRSDPEEDAISYAILHELLAEAEASGKLDEPKVGALLEGKVLHLGDEGASVDIGFRIAAHLPLSEMSLSPVRRARDVVSVGQNLTVEVVQMSSQHVPIISIKKLALQSAWERILKLRDDDEEFNVTVIDINRGGAICIACELRAFLPASHLNGNVTQDLKGKVLTVKILEANHKDGKLTISQKRCRAQMQHPYSVGQVVNATVKGFRDFGVFVELEGGFPALLHISQVSNVRVDPPLDAVFAMGETIKVMVTDSNPKTGKISVSTKSLETFPGETLRNSTTAVENKDGLVEQLQEQDLIPHPDAEM